MTPARIIFDTDPGIDDSMALLLALRSPELDVIGVTTVFGNQSIDKITLNALRVLELAGRTDIPVAAGAGRPLVRDYRGRGADVHGADGLGGANLPAPAGRPAPMHAANLIIESVLANPGEITLIAVGALTNLALAARLEPRTVPAAKAVIIMGGAAYVPGNISPFAEANIYNDPEAAAIVFSAGWPLTMVGLDVMMRVIMSQAYLDELAAAGNPHTDFIARIVPHYMSYYRHHVGTDGIPTHDPAAVTYAVAPHLFTTRRVPVYVEHEGPNAGQTVPDPERARSGGPDIDVCVDVEPEQVLELFKERLAR